MVRKFLKKTAKGKVGLSPGTLVYVGESRETPVTLDLIDYDETHLEEKVVENPEELLAYRDKPTVTWVNINGVHRVDLVEKLGAIFNLHPLTLEDILHLGQRPKYEDYGEYLFVVLKTIQYDEVTGLSDEQLGLVLSKKFLLTFQERPSGIFDNVKKRIHKEGGRIRKMKMDYLAYSLVDGVVDHYFVILEKMEERLEANEAELQTNPTPETLSKVHQLKRDMLFIRKSIWPLREVLNGLLRGETAFFSKPVLPYLKDVYDHAIEVNDNLDAFRDMLSGQTELYLSGLEQKTNEVIKVLTIITTIFIPLSFIAGIYGMNFKFMPELNWRWGYHTIWGLMIFLGVTMIFYFKRKRWI
ncbi:MAG TPA: magnesium/cobalt transporter CorA [Bdellovibrionota bacterium]|nr:magnesium/cobalt transporter CorA [Bdellovibrionota bacterium]